MNMFVGFFIAMVILVIVVSRVIIGHPCGCVKCTIFWTCQCKDCPGSGGICHCAIGKHERKHEGYVNYDAVGAGALVTPRPYHERL